MKNETQKQDFIGAYLDKKMKNHGLPYSMAYYNKLSRHEDEAEKLWAKKQAKKYPCIICGKSLTIMSNECCDSCMKNKTNTLNN